MKIVEMLIPVNEYSRPGKNLKSIAGIVLHWVANPKSSALANRNFLETKQYGKHGYGSFHYVVDLDGSIIHCIPDEEMAYHCGSRTYTEYARVKYGSYPNNCTIAIELCHMDMEGSFTEETLQAAVELCADLCKRHMLNPEEDITTHKNIVGWKACPKWFVDHPDDFQLFLMETAGLL